MGFEDRDYSQQESWSSSGPVDTHSTKWVVILIVATFLMDQLTNSTVLFDLLSLDVRDVYRGQIWRPFTFIFAHVTEDIVAMIFSLLIIWRFGTDLERMYGTTEILMYYAAMTLFVGGIFTLWGLVVPLRAPLWGCYTVSLGLLTLFATHFPRMEVYILPLIAIQLRWLVALYTLFGLFPAIKVLQNGGGFIGLARASTVLSVGFALLYRKYDWHLSAMISRFNLNAWRRAWRSRMARRQLRVYAPTNDFADMDSKVDALLAKIHEHGSESLTDEERAILVRASERMKKRI